ncbi:MAG TPA: nucleotide sugar dehydrogenase [Solirubrobacteraceae bacterium]|nr:nucleotide sugar dehydrogenase [Solirubrobacteraceae bacterium]
MTEALAVPLTDERPQQAVPTTLGPGLSGRQIAVVGLGYVGLPTALSLHDAGAAVFGIDIDEARLEAIRAHDVDLLGGDVARLRTALAGERLTLSTSAAAIRAADAVIVCVPTPVDDGRRPDPRALRAACEAIVARARPGQLLLLSSTTYVGCTRELLVDPLARRGMRVGADIHVAFAPERINPGDSAFRQMAVPRVVGGATPRCRELASEILAAITSDVHEVSSMEVAELTKLYENTFRAVNLALANEMADATVMLGLDPVEVIDAAATKPYGFLRHYPGPGVGGHCIPVDPHYLLEPMHEKGAEAPIIERAMRAIDDRPARVAERAIEILRTRGSDPAGASMLIVGIAYKPGIADVRESPGLVLAEQLAQAGVSVSYHDALVPSVTLGDGTVLHSIGQPDPDRFDLVIVAGLHKAADYHWLERCPDVLDATYRAPGGDRRHLV